MRAFLSHSSVDKALVNTVYEAMQPEAAWIDRAEIEWGDLFLERIEEGIRSASDFVLFWSQAAARSGWVKLELHMAFILAIQERGIRLRVVRIDGSPLPLYLQPFNFLDVSSEGNKAQAVVEALRRGLRVPQAAIRHRFLNRNDELGRIEVAIDDPEVYCAIVSGFAGIGKSSMIKEGLRRFFEGSSQVVIDVGGGTGATELALQLRAEAGRAPLPLGQSSEKNSEDIRVSIETILKAGRLLVFKNVHHWLDETSCSEEPLTTVLSSLAACRDSRTRPALLSSTRRVALDVAHAKGVTQIHIGGLDPEHITTLITLWHELLEGRNLSRADAASVANHLFGHPLAAKLAANLIGQYGAHHLQSYPAELVALRRDLANLLLKDTRISPPTVLLMEGLSIAGTAMPASVMARGLALGEDQFQAAVGEATRAGLLEHGPAMGVHPLLVDHFWRSHLHRSDYKLRAAALAEAVWEHAKAMDRSSPDFCRLLQVAVRLHSLGGNVDLALSLRRDLLGELAQAAVMHYRRRDYRLAEQFIDQVLAGEPHHREMRMYKARVAIRAERWSQADALLRTLESEREGDAGVLHLMGWRQLRANNLAAALELFTRVVAGREHVQSLRDAAECLHRLRRNDEALLFLGRAKRVESGNAFVLDLESRILQARGDLTAAYASASHAVVRDPMNWTFHHRLGQIRMDEKRPDLAIDHFRRATELDPAQFIPMNSLVSALVTDGCVAVARGLLDDLAHRARTPHDKSLVEHARARILQGEGSLAPAAELLEKELDGGRNLVANLGLLAQIRLAQFDEERRRYPASARTYIEKARAVVERGLQLEPANAHLVEFQRQVEERLGGCS